MLALPLRLRVGVLSVSATWQSPVSNTPALDPAISAAGEAMPNREQCAAKDGERGIGNDLSAGVGQLHTTRKKRIVYSNNPPILFLFVREWMDKYRPYFAVIGSSNPYTSHEFPMLIAVTMEAICIR